jgi:hypothetical protein
MPGLEISLETVADEIRTHFWSHEPYRHFEIAVTVVNSGEQQEDNLQFEVLFPEDAVRDYDGSRWRPSHKHEINGKIYLVWATAGASGTGPVIGGMSLTADPRFRWRQELTVNLNPYLKSISILYRLFEKGDPLSDWLKHDVELKPFSPQA